MDDAPLDEDEQVTVSKAGQLRSLALIFVALAAMGTIAIAALVYALVRSSQTLDTANQTIFELTRDTNCRSEAVSAEGGALNNLFIIYITDPTNQQRIGAAVTALVQAHAHRDAVAADGCP